MSGETEANQSGWTTDTLHSHLRQLLDAEMRRLQERHEADQRAVQAALIAHEKAVEKAFSAQTTAMGTAMTAAEKALEQRTLNLDTEFHEHLVQYRHEVTLAFEASDKAITKSEASYEKRFEAVNEFRGQLADQATKFLARTEAQIQFDALSEKIQGNTDRIIELGRRLDLNQGRDKGVSLAWTVGIAAIGAILAILGIVAFFNAGQ